VISGFAGLTVAPAAAAGTPDPFFPKQWALPLIGAPQAWGVARGRGVTIAVLDSGIDASHEDLAGKVLSGIACLGTGGDEARCAGPALDDDGHGTDVAGIAAAIEGNGVGTAGVAPDATLLPVRVLRHTCLPQVNGDLLCQAQGSTDDVRAGIRWAVDHGAQIVNLSVGPDPSTSILHALPIGDAIQYAWSHGVIVVVAAGNEFNTIIGTYYDDLPLVVVAATNRQDQLAAYSNGVGQVRWGLSAPGGAGAQGTCPDQNIIATYTQPGQHNLYRCAWGTSMAAPHVSGALALLRSAGLGPQEAVTRLLGTARHLGAPGTNPIFGAGRLDMAQATSGLALPGPATSPALPAVATSLTPRAGGAVTPIRPALIASTATVDHPARSASSPAADPVLARPRSTNAAPALRGEAAAGRRVPVSARRALIWPAALLALLLVVLATALCRRAILDRWGTTQGT
jgi:subtilisin family serine protease